MSQFGRDQLNTCKTLKVGDKSYRYYSLKSAESQLGSIERLPFSLRILLENLLRYEDGQTVTTDDIKAIVDWQKHKTSDREIAFRPSRVLMQDFTGVPAVVDLAAMREAIKKLGGNPSQINPLSPVDLIIDHSVMVDYFANDEAFQENVECEYGRNRERYAFLRWGQQSFDNFRVVPPGTGICHQVNLEYLGRVVWQKEQNGENFAYPDSLVGTDSHTTMINGLAILGWGVGGIEAEAAMLGQPISMLIPEVVGFKITGALKEGTTATDMVLTVTEMLRKKGVVGKFVEFYGPGLDYLTIADRATISNMAPEYGATCGFFPVDDETLRYLRFTGRDEDTVKLVEAYAKEQNMWRHANTPDPLFTSTLSLDLAEVVPSLAGPKRPQDKIALTNSVEALREALDKEDKLQPGKAKVTYNGQEFELSDGDVVIAAITSCTNTSNPSVMLGAGILARNARNKGLKVKPWVKTSLAPGSQVVTDYLDKAGLTEDLDALGFYLVGYGCTTCIGNSGPLPAPIAKAVEDNDMSVAGVLSGNRNFEGRIHPQVKLNYLASPILVVAYALAGSMKVDLYKDPLGQDQNGNDVFLKDIWPSKEEILDSVTKNLTPQMFTKRYGNVFDGDKLWRSLSDTQSMTYDWVPDSTYVKHPPFFANMNIEPDSITNIYGARPLAILGTA